MSKNLGSDENDFKQHLHFSEHWVVFFFILLIWKVKITYQSNNIPYQTVSANFEGWGILGKIRKGSSFYKS